MKRNSRTRKTWKSIAGIVVSLLVVGSLMFGNVSAALAQDEDPPPPTRGESIDAKLANFYQRELNVLEGQARRIEFGYQAIEKLNTLVERLQERGIDTSELEEIMAEFEDGIDEAQEAHDEAAAILAEHVGFDDDGSVIDRRQAWATVRDAGGKLYETFSKLGDTFIEFWESFREWREAIRAEVQRES